MFSRATIQADGFPAPALSSEPKRDANGKDVGPYIFAVEEQLWLNELNRDRAASADRHVTGHIVDGYRNQAMTLTSRERENQHQYELIMIRKAEMSGEYNKAELWRNAMKMDALGKNTAAATYRAEAKAL